jgi:hypothetical protein
MRSHVDAVGKDVIPGLKDIDEVWRKQQLEIDEMKSKLVYEQ